LLIRQIIWLWDDNVNNDDEVFILTVDGVHCAIQEPRTEPDAAWYSHKHHCAGVTYEIAIALRSNHCVWIEGPNQSSIHDLRVFRGGDVVEEGSLAAKMPPGKRLIGDCGYLGEAELISTRNTFDTPEVKVMKMRARARHETFNGRIKNFNILAERFRHDVSKHQIVFVAVCVIIQYDMENGCPLFTV
jgi:hypothetical protein